MASEGWIPELLDRMGYVGVALLMLVENVFPPIPSEVVMPYAGYVAANGELSLGGVVVAGIIGSVVGAMPWYGLGWWLGKDRVRRFAERHGRWLTLRPSDVDNILEWFEEKGRIAVLFGRMIPGVRTVISLPAGVSGMSLPRFLLYTTIGSAAWTTGLAVLGWWLGQEWESVGKWLGPISNVILAGALAIYLYRVVRFEPD
jgi:membrane protein DedA with SNARE-associated domain